VEVEMNDEHPDVKSQGFEADATRLVHAPGEDGPPISPLDPSSMPRSEDDAETMANSPEFHDVPGSGNDLLKPKK
jgi:hypothetical protein